MPGDNRRCIRCRGIEYNSSGKFIIHRPTCEKCRTQEEELLYNQLPGKTSSENISWRSMKQRCNNPNDPSYAIYGGIGIIYCSRWEYFENFYADMGPRPSGTSLDRYPNKNGNYEPSNCRWATPVEQARNRSTNTLVEHKGKLVTLVELSELVRVPYGIITNRYTKGLRGRELTAPPLRKHLKYLYKGMYVNLKELSDLVDIPAKTLYSRIHVTGMSVEEAVNTPWFVKKDPKDYYKNKIVNWKGLNISLNDLSVQTNISLATIVARFKAGWPQDELASKVDRRIQKYRRKQ